MKKNKAKKEIESEQKMPYHVGQVLFIILNKKMQVYPMMIVEEIIKKTLQGEEINYVLQGGADTSATVLLNKVDGEVFTSAKEARQVLIERATQQIEKIIDAAVAKASEWYSQPSPQQEERQPLEKTNMSAATPMQIELSDGTVATFRGSVG